MATRRNAPKVRRRREHQARIDGPVYGVPVPEALHKAIENERDNLSKAESLLACMVVAMEYQNDPVAGPYYPAVAQIARELVGRSIDSLDPFVLRQRLLRNKIEEALCISFVDRTTHDAPFGALLSGPDQNGIPGMVPNHLLNNCA
jgi:hypothetical protein